MKNIVLKYGDIRNTTFLEIVQRMIDAKLPVPVAAKIFHLAKQINEERNFANNLVDNLLKEHSEVLKEEGKPDAYVIKTDQVTEFNKKLNELNETKIPTRLEQISPEQVSKLELSVNELLAIAPLLVGGEELTELGTDAPALPAEAFAPA